MNIKKITKTSFKLMILQFMYYISLATLYSYMVNILTDMGYGAFWAGVLRFSIAGAAILSNMIKGYIADTFIPVKNLIVIMLSTSAILSIFLLPVIASIGNPLYLAIIVSIISFLDYSNGVDMDIWAVKLIKNEKKGDFGFIRSGGSAGYAIAALIFGFAIEGFGTNILYYWHGAFLFLTVIIASTIPSIPCQNIEDYDADIISVKSAVRLLLFNLNYIKLILTSILMYFAMTPVTTFLFLYILKAGGSSSHLGIAWVVSSIAQIISMMIASRFLTRGFSMNAVLCGALVIGSIRSFTLYISTSLWLMILFMAFHGFSFGGFTRTFAEHVSVIVPKKIVSTATTLGQALSVGIGVMLGSLLGGIMIDRVGLNNYALLCGVIYIIAAFVMSSNFKSIKKEYRQVIE